MSDLKHRHQRPEGALIERALNAPPKMSMRKLAEAAGMSEGRVRQIINGYQSQAGQVLSIIGPAETVARLATAAGVTADEMHTAGRGDAAEVMRGGVVDAEDPHQVVMPTSASQNRYFLGGLVMLHQIGDEVPTLRPRVYSVLSEYTELFTTYVDHLGKQAEGGEDHDDSRTTKAPLSAVDDELPAAAKEGLIEEPGEFNT